MKKLLTCLVLTAAAAATSPVRAGWDEFWNGVHSGYEANNNWPSPYVEADRVAVMAPFHMMVSKGWERQNLIGDNYFDEGTSKLNQAGVMKIRSILSQSQPEHRTIFVERDLADDVTKARLDLVERAAAAMQSRGPLPEVLVSDLTTEGRSAELVAAEHKAYVGSVPTPRLAKAGGGASGGSGGGSGSSGAGSQ